MVDALQRAVPVPQLQIVVHRALRRQVFWQSLPLAAGALMKMASHGLARYEYMLANFQITHDFKSTMAEELFSGRVI
jgi:hypothetical protein